MSKVTDSEVRLVLRTMAKVQDAALDYSLSKYTDDHMLTVELIELRNKLGEIIDRNRKDASAAQPPSTARAMNNANAVLKVSIPVELEMVDDMLCVTGHTILRCGDYAVHVFHCDTDNKIVGLRIPSVGDDTYVVKIGERATLRYTDPEVCATCGEPFTKKDIDGGRCLSCGSMIT